ncbi:hypothetical protein OG747_36785 [Streptomyces sp. NBC_01384]|uniref:hypothetical protein n=1 Tax=Streptomyces sp. NBC_01384 TaxID=2903847 RepID=UPI00324E2DBB
MRVRMLKAARAYWNYAVQEFKEGEEYFGDLARHLADNAPVGSVKVMEADPEPEPEPEAPAASPDPESADVGDGPPVDGTIDALMAWVNDDPVRAAQALVAEQAKDKPRSTVVKRLSAMADIEE